MEKKSIHIQKIKDGFLYSKEDELAVEHLEEIKLHDGRILQIACTPSYIAEMVLGRRFLLNDLTEQEMKRIRKRQEESAEPVFLKQVKLQEIFRIAEETFERPGTLFNDTGCAHCCALVHDGKIKCCIEDIGRHNALDKVIGYALENGISMEQSYLYTSGRISGDYLQKVIRAGFRMAVSRAAVTAAAAALAEEKDITMLGFVRKQSGNVYHIGSIKLSE